MTVFRAALEATAALGAFGAIASERARAYGLKLSLLQTSAIVPAAMAAGVSLWLAANGRGAEPKVLILACAAVSAATDLQTGYIFDRVVIGSLCATLFLAACAQSLAAAVAGGIVGGGLPLLVFAATSGRGIGLGDVKLAAAIGAALQTAGALESLRIAVFCGAAAGLVFRLFGRLRRDGKMRFAPFLALGATYGVLTCG